MKYHMFMPVTMPDGKPGHRKTQSLCFKRNSYIFGTSKNKWLASYDKDPSGCCKNCAKEAERRGLLVIEELKFEGMEVTKSLFTFLHKLKYKALEFDGTTLKLSGETTTNLYVACLIGRGERLHMGKVLLVDGLDEKMKPTGEKVVVIRIGRKNWNWGTALAVCTWEKAPKELTAY